MTRPAMRLLMDEDLHEPRYARVQDLPSAVRDARQCQGHDCGVKLRRRPGESLERFVQRTLCAGCAPIPEKRP
jgi:hypothetical protein